MSLEKVAAAARRTAAALRAQAQAIQDQNDPANHAARGVALNAQFIASSWDIYAAELLQEAKR